MDYFMKWPAVYTITNQQASIIGDVMLTKFCPFVVPMELQNARAESFNPVQFRRSWSDRRSENLEQHPYSSSQMECWNAT